MTIKNEIEAARRKVYDIEQQLEQAQTKLKAALAKQKDCPHVMARPWENYEHEGGYCINCGVNELYAMTLKGLPS